MNQQIDNPSAEGEVSETQAHAVATKEVVDRSRGYLAGLMYEGKHGDEIFQAGEIEGAW